MTSANDLRQLLARARYADNVARRYGGARVATTGVGFQLVNFCTSDDPIRYWCRYCDDTNARLTPQARVACVLACQATLLLDRAPRAKEIILLARAFGAEPKPVLALMGLLPTDDGMIYCDAFTQSVSPDAPKRREEIAARALLRLLCPAR